MESRWILAETSAPTAEIAWDEICGFPCIVEHLKRKNFTDASALDAFLQPRLKTLSDPFLLPQMEIAVARILRAIDTRQRIVLFGDYDVDGVTSLALLTEMLRSYGAETAWFLPLRMEEGYGLSAESVARCCEEHRPELLIAVDCGTSSSTEIANLNARGVDVIVLDHHEPKATLPDCVAMVNPKTSARCDHHYLCSVGVVFKLCHALLKTRPSVDFDLKRQLDLVALGTVADIVPLHRENRVLVKRGAMELARTSRPGIRRLMEVAGVKAPIATEDIGFKLGPRLNAAGRLATAEKALRLLLTKDGAEATELAAFLDLQNRERQAVEKEVFLAADAQVEQEFVCERDAAIVVAARGWHPGVLGIVASRLMRKYHRPAIVIGFDEDGVGKGSGRSIEGLSIVEGLTRCERWLLKFGGHEMAAGLTITESDFPAFRAAFCAAARELLSDEQLAACLHLDHEISFRELNRDFLDWHERLQPFGSGNPQPTFLSRGVEPTVTPQVLKEKHLVLRLRQRQHHHRAIFFGGATTQLPPAPWDVAFRISADLYEGETRLQMQVQAMRAAVPTA